MDTEDIMMLTNMIIHVNICAEARSSPDCDHGSWPLWLFRMNSSTILNTNMCTTIIIIDNLEKYDI